MLMQFHLLCIYIYCLLTKAIFSSAHLLFEWVHRDFPRAHEGEKKVRARGRDALRCKGEAEREVGEASMRADIVDMRAEDAEAALKEAIEENFQLLERIKELEAQLEASGEEDSGGCFQGY